MHTILVTGGNGTLGYNILRRLAKNAQYRVVSPVRSTTYAGIQALATNIQFIEQDLSDAPHTAQMIERVNPDTIIHCAASGLRPPRAEWFDLMQFNVVSTLALFQINCRLSQPTHFIFISSGLVYKEQGRPLKEEDPIETLHPYGASKAASDLLLQAASAEFRRRVTILRPFAFTGLHDHENRLFPSILRAAVENHRMGLTAGTQIRDFLSVNDVADAVLRVIERKDGGLTEKFNLGSGICQPLRDVIENVCMELELKVDLAFGDRSMHPYEPHHSVADIGLSEAELGWKPQTSLASSVWELAQEIAPTLKLRRPETTLGNM